MDWILSSVNYDMEVVYKREGGNYFTLLSVFPWNNRGKFREILEGELLPFLLLWIVYRLAHNQTQDFPNKKQEVSAPEFRNSIHYELREKREVSFCVVG